MTDKEILTEIIIELRKHCDRNGMSVATYTSYRNYLEKIITEKTTSKQQNLEKRMGIFLHNIAFHSEGYSKKMLEEFFDYWSEPNKSRTKMRLELEKTWDLKRRLARWNRSNTGGKPDPLEVDLLSDK